MNLKAHKGLVSEDTFTSGWHIHHVLTLSFTGTGVYHVLSSYNPQHSCCHLQPIKLYCMDGNICCGIDYCWGEFKRLCVVYLALEERFAQAVCFLLVDLYLLTFQPEKALHLLAVLDKLSAHGNNKNSKGEVWNCTHVPVKSSLKHKQQCSGGVVHLKRVHLNPERATKEMIPAEIATAMN